MYSQEFISRYTYKRNIGLTIFPVNNSSTVETLVAEETQDRISKHYKRPGYEARTPVRLQTLTRRTWFEVRESKIIGKNHNVMDLFLFT